MCNYDYWKTTPPDDDGEKFCQECAICGNAIYPEDVIYNIPDIGMICEECKLNGMVSAEEPDPDDDPIECCDCGKEVNGEDYCVINDNIYCSGCIDEMESHFYPDEGPDPDLCRDDF